MNRKGNARWQQIMQLLAGTKGQRNQSQLAMDPDVQEFWFADFARRSAFERLMLERAGEQQPH